MNFFKQYNMKIKNLRFLLPVFIFLVLVMFILPYYSYEGYSIIEHTTSLLGAQNTPNAWVMNLTFILLGIAIFLESLFHLKQYWIPKILLNIFALGLILVGIFQHAPLMENMTYNVVDDNLHSVFASLVGFSFIIFAFTTVFVEKTNFRRILAFLVGISVTILSLLMFNLSDFAGLWQRLMFIIAFSWLIFFLERIRLIKNC
jgi:hypothetical membrane protein